jgi:L-amino acid N-acyltransferase YncA
MPRRIEYTAELAAVDAGLGEDVPPGARRPAAGDEWALAELMLDAYRGTIDYDGETLDDARAEVGSYLRGATDPALLGCSWVVEQGGVIVAACLASYWQERARPLIAYLMTRADWKGRGLGQGLAAMCLASLRAAGYTQARAVITAGNEPSERIFKKLGFTQNTEALRE